MKQNYGRVRRYGCRALIACIACSCMPLLAQSAEAESNFRMAVADASTRVLIATVNLTIGDLQLEVGDVPRLTGSYAIEVPIRSSKDESGELILELDRAFTDYLANGGVLTGRGFSDIRPGAQRLITCTIEPDPQDPRRGALEIEIDTGNRKLAFATTYEIHGALPRASADTLAAHSGVGDNSAGRG